MALMLTSSTLSTNKFYLVLHFHLIALSIQLVSVSTSFYKKSQQQEEQQQEQQQQLLNY